LAFVQPEAESGRNDSESTKTKPNNRVKKGITVRRRRFPGVALGDSVVAIAEDKGLGAEDTDVALGDSVVAIAEDKGLGAEDTDVALGDSVVAIAEDKGLGDGEGKGLGAEVANKVL
jgi:hypothetical protein